MFADLAGSYETTFAFLGSVQIISGILLSFIPFILKKQQFDYQDFTWTLSNVNNLPMTLTEFGNQGILANFVQWTSSIDSGQIDFSKHY